MANLLKTGQLKEHRAGPQEIGRLMAAAERSLADARVAAVSAETRFDAAYRAIMQIGLAALMAQGYRPDTNRPIGMEIQREPVSRDRRAALFKSRVDH